MICANMEIQISLVEINIKERYLDTYKGKNKANALRSDGRSAILTVITNDCFPP